MSFFFYLIHFWLATGSTNRREPTKNVLREKRHESITKRPSHSFQYSSHIIIIQTLWSKVDDECLEYWAVVCLSFPVSWVSFGYLFIFSISFSWVREMSPRKGNERENKKISNQKILCTSSTSSFLASGQGHIFYEREKDGGRRSGQGFIFFLLL